MYLRQICTFFSNHTADMFLSFCLLVTFVLGLSGCLGSYVPCEPCDDKAMSMCPPVPLGCQLVKEPGCGCCLTCALSEGQACGVYTGTCTQGLRCLPRSGEEKPLHALLHGRGVCTNEKGYKPSHPPIGKMPPPRPSALLPPRRTHPGRHGGDNGSEGGEGALAGDMEEYRALTPCRV